MRLTRTVRSLLVVVSAVCYAASVTNVGDPLDARGLDRIAPPKRGFGDVRPVLPAALVIRRDPFEGGPATAPERHDAFSPETTAAVSVPDIDPAAAGPVDPAAPGMPVSAQPADAVAVRATIVGPRPVAYVEVGDDVRIVRVGDLCAGRRIAAIDLAGVAFTDGTRLSLPGTYLATPEPRRAPHTHVDPVFAEIAKLRAIVSGHRDKGTPASATAPARRAEDSTPSPQRTVDARGLPAGVNPTPDFVDPTARPYPYPYAPAIH